MLVLVVSVLLTPHAVEAQQVRNPHRVGVLVPATWEPAAFRQTLRELGYVEGSNLVLHLRLADGKLEQLPALARDLVSAAPDVIVAVNTPGTRAAIAATRTIPIVMVAVGDPIGTGFVSNFARPEGNVTGVSNLCGELGAKRLALLKETVPKAVRIAVLLNPNDPITVPQTKDIERAAPLLGVQVRFFPARTPQELASVFEQVMKWQPDSALWLCGQQGALERRMMPLASNSRLPMMTYQAESVDAGGLISYSTDNADLFRRAAVYVDKVLKGAKASDIPVEQPTKFQLVVNLKTAKTIGLAVPPSVLLRADRVIDFDSR